MLFRSDPRNYTPSLLKLMGADELVIISKRRMHSAWKLFLSLAGIVLMIIQVHSAASIVQSSL
jgi:hypothetical protein